MNGCVFPERCLFFRLLCACYVLYFCLFPENIYGIKINVFSGK
ncbi:unnamed protein product [Meloidogyne enterolobii]|uniref:Uncharacterized protein n=1 Tax=Meloidogyne enterolobii TaxID=390850 RepID=A0ACB0Y0G8_MELEN